MSIVDEAPDSIVVDFVGTTGQSIRFIDMGSDFLRLNSLSAEAMGDKPLRVAVERKRSKAGNAYYEYSQNGLPLPDGLNTLIRVEGIVLPMGRTRPSKSGHPTREGSATLMVGTSPYVVTAYITEGKTPFYIKVIAHKAPNKQTNIEKALVAPKGGRFI